ncbi:MULTISPECIES: ADP-forming succinate--CoA ligase subunit beta [Methylococcus]|uniref:Succinate--CoA ligase [ADP-forming] subunit beta n=2 Tax=Methylococcus capsulatus TaxID=414 RepID=Q607L9_METCA|nr:ADP-forming succinate--CoA ligase subunit beta [Methylococcus capsulatus]AVA07550.1 succinate-CoA ligase [synthetic construct]AAU91976.1 succinyl-CoA synthase, beta subunit [Methylococcus capsulatus str. Bath]QXP87606.1 ADP-forming succinate--CoA ligase subunit beta [Methylococcus capsulatus]QXP91038.1 ADP-forming succinate--CoA ligase subunit beta [Methylococcus capsulatus]QXP92654.1 ADP-forming succinate--CoA ligase subunit beta [Methylococcus capsulatus]
MNIHEYQAKELLKTYGVPVPDGAVAYSDAQAASVAEEIGGSRWVVKAQIHAGGRGKAGGVKVAHSIEEVRQYADAMLGSHLVTHQTGPGGSLVQRLWVEQASHIKKEYYLGFVIDRGNQRITLIASSEGGMEIEEVAKETPEKIVKEVVDPAIGLLDFQCRKVATAIGLKGKLMPQAVRLMKAIYRCMRDKDALQAEINPLAIVGESDESLMVLDAKFNFDDNALYRQRTITEMRDLAEEDPKEVEASGHGLNYIALDGNIGCIVNGAGLAMASLDAITLHGGRPANFLDVGGGASPEKVTNACRIVLEDPNVRCILVNIFAGINRCDWIAKGLIQACDSLQIKVPLIVRLAGTNVDEGRKILAESGLSFITAENLDDAAAKAVAIVKG